MVLEKLLLIAPSACMDLGPGLLETVYEVLLVHLFESQGLSVNRQVGVPIEYHGIKFQEGFRADIIIEGEAVVELKSMESISKAHKKQALTYLKLTGCKFGYLLNFARGLDEG